MENFALPTIWLPWSIVGTEKSEWMFDSFFLFNQFPDYELFSKDHPKLSIIFYLYAIMHFNIFDILHYFTLVLFNSQILSSLVSGSDFHLVPGLLTWLWFLVWPWVSVWPCTSAVLELITSQGVLIPVSWKFKTKVWALGWLLITSRLIRLWPLFLAD